MSFGREFYAEFVARETFRMANSPRYETVRVADRYEYEHEINMRAAWVFWDRPKLFARFAWRAARAAFLAAWHDARGTTETRVVPSPSQRRMHAVVTNVTS